MTKIGYRFINWALIFLAGFIFYELTRNANGMEGTIVSEKLKSDGYGKDYCLIDLDDSFVYILIEKDNTIKIGDKVKIKTPNKSIIEDSYVLQTIPIIMFAILCLGVAITRIFLILDDDYSYRHLKD